jgi:hypothetical protein
MTGSQHGLPNELRGSKSTHLRSPTSRQRRPQSGTPWPSRGSSKGKCDNAHVGQCVGVQGRPRPRRSSIGPAVMAVGLNTDVIAGIMAARVADSVMTSGAALSADGDSDTAPSTRDT